LLIGRPISKNPATNSTEITPTAIRALRSTCEGALDAAALPEPASCLTSFTKSVSIAKVLWSPWCCSTTLVAISAAPWEGSIPLLYAPKCISRVSRKPTANWACPLNVLMSWFIELL
jgi:hypothetical protein